MVNPLKRSCDFMQYNFPLRQRAASGAAGEAAVDSGLEGVEREDPSW